MPIYIDQQNKLPQLRQTYPRYQQNYAKTLQMTLRQLNADFKSFFVLRNKGYADANPPRPKSKKYFTTIVYNQLGFKIIGNQITFNHFYPTKETKKVALTFQLHDKFDFTNKIIKQVTIFQVHKTKEFYISIIYEE